MKDEANGDQIVEFVALRPKMYSFLVPDDKIQPEHHRAKGMQYAASKQLKHQDYLNQLHNPTENTYINHRIGAKLHNLYSIQMDKRGLCAFDDKRVLLEDNINTYAYGHYRVTGEINSPDEEIDDTITSPNMQTETIRKEEISLGIDMNAFLTKYHMDVYNKKKKSNSSIGEGNADESKLSSRNTRFTIF